MVQLVGILNLTPDSFSDGGQFNDPAAALARAAQLFDDGASLVDIGAESTRPGATRLTTEVEWQRLMPVLQQLTERYPEQISVDTYHPKTAAKALDVGDVIINDVTGMQDSGMVQLVTERRARCVISHLPTLTTQAAHTGTLISSVQQVVSDLLAKAEELQRHGLPAENIILDPGLGFGKTEELNRKLLRFAEEVPDYKVMIGYSRKRFLGEKRMELQTNLEAGRIAIEAGAAYLRVHDVAGHRKLLYTGKHVR
ncbi:MAG TPA: dihydropteroate synthase [Verrucomicrobiae bacterium]|nr:dihydropteroate synthase [Verrucomicrobiae bacterium]